MRTESAEARSTPRIAGGRMFSAASASGFVLLGGAALFLVLAPGLQAVVYDTSRPGGITSGPGGLLTIRGTVNGRPMAVSIVATGEGRADAMDSTAARLRSEGFRVQYDSQGPGVFLLATREDRTAGYLFVEEKPGGPMRGLGIEMPNEEWRALGSASAFGSYRLPPPPLALDRQSLALMGYKVEVYETSMPPEAVADFYAGHFEAVGAAGLALPSLGSARPGARLLMIEDASGHSGFAQIMPRDGGGGIVAAVTTSTR